MVPHTQCQRNEPRLRLTYPYTASYLRPLRMVGLEKAVGIKGSVIEAGSSLFMCVISKLASLYAVSRLYYRLKEQLQRKRTLLL